MNENYRKAPEEYRAAKWDFDMVDVIAGYAVDVWKHTKDGSRKTDI